MSIHESKDPKIITFQQAAELIKRVNKSGQITILAQGVFDVIHIGHTNFLKEAKQKGDILFVGIELDQSVKLNKGSSRPFNPLDERMQLIADLQCVDFVFAFDESLPYGSSSSALHSARLNQLRPQMLALSIGDPLFDIRHKNALRIGVRIAIVSGVWRQYSTTKLLTYIRGA